MCFACLSEVRRHQHSFFLSDSGGMGTMVDPMFEFAVGLHKLQLDETELALLSALLLMQSGELCLWLREQGGETQPRLRRRSQAGSVGSATQQNSPACTTSNTQSCVLQFVLSAMLSQQFCHTIFNWELCGAFCVLSWSEGFWAVCTLHVHLRGVSFCPTWSRLLFQIGLV